MTIRTALVGYGLGGRTFHAPLLASVPGIELAAVVSSQADRVRAEWPGVAVTPEFRDVLNDPDIGLVVVSTPNVTHFELATRAMAAGKHVVVDKPFTISVAQARALATAASATGVVVSVFHNRRWDADFLTLQRLMAAGALGEINTIESRYDRFRPVVRDRWREREEPGAGTWFDLGAHLVDQVLVLWGRPVDVTADLTAQRPGARATDYFHVVLRYAGERRAILHGGSLAPASGLRYVVHGSKASYVKFGLDTQEHALKRGERPGGDDYGVDPIEGELTMAEGSNEEAVQLVENERGNYARYYEGVCAAIAGEGPPPVTAADGIAVMVVIEAATRSAARNETVPL